MKRKRILTQYLLYFIMLMFLLVAGCSDGGDDNDAADEAAVDAWVTVSGTVTTAGGTPVPGVVISPMINLSLLGVNLASISYSSNTFNLVVTDANGTYSMTVPAALVENYTLVLTPSKKGYVFTPQERVLTITGSTDQTGVNFVATARNEFSQADLTGTWRINMLRAGNENSWMRARITIGATGVATCNSMYYSDDPLTNVCPAVPTEFELTFTMSSEGVITQSGANAVTDGGHMTMNSGKNFAAGTGTSGSSSYQLMVAQKEDVAVTTNVSATPVTTHYVPGDVQSKAMVFHSLSVGGTNQWRYGAGETSGTGVITMTSEADSAGGTATSLDGWTLSLAADGYVTRTDVAGLLSDFQGFLSADEKTIVGTYSENGTDYKLIIIQFNNQQTVDTMTGTSTNHLLAVPDAANVGAGATNLWAYHDVNISRFEATFLPDVLGLTARMNIMLEYNWNLSLPEYQGDANVLKRLGLMKFRYITIDAADTTTRGRAIIDTVQGVRKFHGQLACDGTYMVGVETLTLDEGTFYALDIITHEANN